MLDMRKRTSEDPDDVYVICRVYNLLSSKINMRFYVSPGRDEEGRGATSHNGSGTSGIFDETPILKFTSKGYEVVPSK